MGRTAPALVAAVVVGALVALQARVNAGLAETLDDALLAAVVSFGTGLVVAVVLLAFRDVLLPLFTDDAAVLEQAEVDAHLPHRAHSLFPLLSWRLSAAPTAGLAALRTLLEDRPRTEDR